MATLFFSLQTLFGGDRDIGGDTVRIAAVGDSITFGYGISIRARRSWPSRLEQLGEGYLSVGNFGSNGATLLSRGDDPYIQTSQYHQAQEYAPHIVIIALGTNDAKRSNSEHLGDFVENYRSLIRSFRSLESEPLVFLCIPPPAYGNMWGIDYEVLEEGITPLILETASLEGLGVIDLRPPFEGNKTRIPDGVHPDADGAELIAHAIFNSIKTADLDAMGVLIP